MVLETPTRVAVFIVPLCLFGLMGLIVLIRAVVKVKTAKTFQVVDGLIYLSFFFAGALNIGCSLLTIYGLGDDIDAVETQALAVFSKIAIALGMLYSLGLTLAKVALVYSSQYLGIRRAAVKRVSKRLLLAALVLQATEEIVVTMLACHPSQGRALFQLSVTNRCAQQRPMWFTGFVLNFLFEFALLLGPACELWRKWSEPFVAKIEPLAAILSYTLVVANTAGRSAAVAAIGTNTTRDYAPAILWSVGEADAFVVSLCLPYLASKWRPTSSPSRATTLQDQPTGTSKAGDKNSPRRLSTKPSNASDNSIPRMAGTSGGIEMLVCNADSNASPLRPTPDESMDWVERMQSFPTEGRPQHVMASTNMGTTSCAEAVLQTSQGDSNLDFPEENQRGNLAAQLERGGIWVVTEVRREVIQDPNYQFGAGTSSYVEALGHHQPYWEDDAISILQV